MSRISVPIIFFAKSRDLVKKEQAQISVPNPISYSDLKKLILALFPELAPIKKSFFIALNQEYLKAGQKEIHIKPEDILAIIPPISGG